jgi:hypothetical protein
VDDVNWSDGDTGQRFELLQLANTAIRLCRQASLE